MRIVSVMVLMLVTSATGLAQKPANCGGFDALIGDWEGISRSSVTATGGFSFRKEVQDKVIVRRNFAEYPASKDTPAFRHDDLMVIYTSSLGSRADYWDNEGHVIHYAIDISPDKCTIAFESDRHPFEPTYKLTYTLKSPDEVSIAFQIAPPGKEFGGYITASAKRKH